jgi:transposase InsO family protein
VTAELRLGHGIVVSRKRVQRLMRAAGISGLVARKRGRTTIGVPGVRVADDLVKRDFRPDRPDVLWVADIERHEALHDRAVVKGHRGSSVAAGGCKLGAA